MRPLHSRRLAAAPSVARSAVLPLLAGLALVACGATGGDDATSVGTGADVEPDEDSLELEVLPTPYTADEIRAACASGRQLVFRVEAGGNPPLRQKMRFEDADDEGVTVEAWAESLDGQPLGPRSESRAAWSELRDHALLPAGSTRERTTVTVPQGTHEAWLYVQTWVQDGSTHERRMWFADRFPGPPVKNVEVVDGREILQVELEAVALP